MTAPHGNQTITGVKRSEGPPDVLGVPLRVETTFTIERCSVQPLSTVEQLSNVDQVTTRLHLYAPAGTPLTVTDAVIVDGVTYELDGDPQTWTDARGRPYYLDCLIRRATG